MSTAPLLTIAIPTYNRTESLVDNLRFLFPQLQKHAAMCRLLIVDNCSTEPVAPNLAPLLAQYPEVQCSVVRNKGNIGLAANVIRPFELCETPYLWVLSDDDEVKPEAIQTIAEHIAAQPDCVFIHFSMDHHRPRAVATKTHGGLEFLRAIKTHGGSLGNIFFISTAVYKVSPLLANLRFAYQFGYTMAPHFAMLVQTLQSLGDSGACYLSADVIVKLRRPDEEQSWPAVALAMGVPLLLEMPLQPAVRSELAQRLDSFPDEFLSTRQLAHRLLLSYLAEGDAGALHSYDQIRFRRHHFRARAKDKAAAWLWRWPLRFPRPGIRVLKVLYRLKGDDKLDRGTLQGLQKQRERH